MLAAHLWLIAWTLGLISRVVNLWETRSAARRQKMQELTRKNKVTVIDVKATKVEEEK